MAEPGVVVGVVVIVDKVPANQIVDLPVSIGVLAILPVPVRQQVTGIDVGEDVLESRYNFHSMKHKHAIEVRIAVPVKKANIPSIEQLWRIGDWFERETYDMVGITFEGHRDLRRMLLPEDWEGYPLRKDYDVQETYHGIAVPKVKEGWE